MTVPAEPADDAPTETTMLPPDPVTGVPVATTIDPLVLGPDDVDKAMLPDAYDVAPEPDVITRLPPEDARLAPPVSTTLPPVLEP